MATFDFENLITIMEKGNAGNKFDDTPNIPWVDPNENLQGEKYDNVRGVNGNDKIEEVLKNDKNLDFTQANNSTYNKFLRLLMPRYTRRVEVEDLNRNFWVIGQALTAVCKYLVESKEIITDVHTEVIDYPRAVDKPFRDINSFVSVPNLDPGNNGEIDEPARLKAYRQLYPNSNLCLLIRCRIGNYEKDYYHTEVYPYIVCYDINKNKWYSIKLLDYNDKTFGITNRINSADTEYDYMNIRGHIYGLSEISPNNYRFYYPIGDLPPTQDYTNTHWDRDIPEEETSHIYHSMVWIKPSIEANYNSNRGIIINLSFSVYDIARKLHFLGNNSSEEPDSDKDKYKDEGENSKKYICVINFPDSVVAGNDFEWKSGERSPFAEWPEWIAKGFSTNYRDSGYQCGMYDMVTYKGVTKRKEGQFKYEFTRRQIGDNEATILKIGNYLPETVTLGGINDGQVGSKNASVYIATIKPEGKSIITNLFMDWVPRENTPSGSVINYNNTNYNFYWNKQCRDDPTTTEQISTEKAYVKIEDNAAPGDKIFLRFKDYVLPNLLKGNENNLCYYLIEYGDIGTAWYNEDGKMYWKTRTIAFLVRYIPIADSSQNYKVYKNRKQIGYIDINQSLSYKDKAYSGTAINDNETNPFEISFTKNASSNNTWRVPNFVDVTTGESSIYWSCTKTYPNDTTETEFFTDEAITNLFGQQTNDFTKNNVKETQARIYDEAAVASQATLFNLDNFAGEIQLLNGYNNSIQVRATIDQDGRIIRGTKYYNGQAGNYVLSQ